MPRLETPRLLLRPLQASDVAVLVAIWADPDVTRYTGGGRVARARSARRQYPLGRVVVSRLIARSHPDTVPAPRLPQRGGSQSQKAAGRPGSPQRRGRAEQGPSS